MQELSVKLNSL